ncbi:MAG: alpha/beta fold hydrolase, partial [Actinobacteria bacterium]
MPSTDIIDLDGPVHIADHGGEGRLVIFVHGLEGSHLNWMAVAPAVAEHHRVIAPDLWGFGLTPPGPKGCGVEANADLVAELADA